MPRMLPLGRRLALAEWAAYWAARLLGLEVVRLQFRAFGPAYGRIRIEYARPTLVRLVCENGELRHPADTHQG